MYVNNILCGIDVKKLCILRILYFIGLMHGVLKTFLGNYDVTMYSEILYSGWGGHLGGEVTWMGRSPG